MLIEFLIAITFGPPQRIVTLDKIKGEPIQMAWSPDDGQLYVESGQRTRIGTFESPKHYVVTIATQQVKNVDAPPQWATDYQAWKGNKWAPGNHALVINITEENRTVRAVSAPMGGALAKGGETGASTSVDEALGAALTSQTEHVITLKLKGEVVGEYVNTQFMPGYTFGWAPQSLGPYIAYGRPDGRLVVLDPQGSKTLAADAKNVVLPAWANSGKKIAYIEKNGKKFDLFITDWQ